jgi:putative transcriptional regulator
MVLYDKLWNTMKTKGISQYRLINYYGMSSGQLCRLRNNEYVSTHTIEVLCTILNCPVEDIMEVRPDDSLAPIMNGELRQR